MVRSIFLMGLCLAGSQGFGVTKDSFLDKDPVNSPKQEAIDRPLLEGKRKSVFELPKSKEQRLNPISITEPVIKSSNNVLSGLGESKEPYDDTGDSDSTEIVSPQSQESSNNVLPGLGESKEPHKDTDGAPTGIVSPRAAFLIEKNQSESSEDGQDFITKKLQQSLVVMTFEVSYEIKAWFDPTKKINEEIIKCDSNCWVKRYNHQLNQIADELNGVEPVPKISDNETWNYSRCGVFEYVIDSLRGVIYDPEAAPERKERAMEIRSLLENLPPLKLKPTIHFEKDWLQRRLEYLQKNSLSVKPPSYTQKTHLIGPAFGTEFFEKE